MVNYYEDLKSEMLLYGEFDSEGDFHLNKDLDIVHSSRLLAESKYFAHETSWRDNGFSPENSLFFIASRVLSSLCCANFTGLTREKLENEVLSDIGFFFSERVFRLE
jgi:hypothetical protein